MHGTQCQATHLLVKRPQHLPQNALPPQKQTLTYESWLPSMVGEQTSGSEPTISEPYGKSAILRCSAVRLLSWLRIQRLRFGVSGFGFEVWGVRFRVLGVGLQVLGTGAKAYSPTVGSEVSKPSGGGFWLLACLDSGRDEFEQAELRLSGELIVFTPKRLIDFCITQL